MTYTLSKYRKVEGMLHMLFWIFIFSAINVSWHRDWFDATIRTNTPSPLSVLLFPLLFYAHSFWAIPKFLSTRKWLLYGLSLFMIFAVPELLRLLLYHYFLNRPLYMEFSGRDSFILGSPSIAWLAFVFSLIYSLILESNLLSRQSKPQSRTISETALKVPVISNEEAHKIEVELYKLMNEEQVFLQTDLNLYKLSERLSITDKKLSTFLNQHLNTNFTDYLNGFRIHCFTKKIESGKLQDLSIIGLANQCGFSSKPTFYRAFKKVKGCTPTEYLRSKNIS